MKSKTSRFFSDVWFNFRYGDWKDRCLAVVVWSFLAALAAVFACLGESLFATRAELKPAVVVTRSFNDSQVSSGYGGGRHGGYVVTYTPEKWLLIVRTEEGEVVPVETNSDRWAATHDGDEVGLQLWRGPLTGIMYRKSIE